MVTVPLASPYVSPRASSAPVSQDQHTSGRSGSAAISGSSSARTSVTSRKVPCQAS